MLSSFTPKISKSVSLPVKLEVTLAAGQLGTSAVLEAYYSSLITLAAPTYPRDLKETYPCQRDDTV